MFWLGVTVAMTIAFGYMGVGGYQLRSRRDRRLATYTLGDLGMTLYWLAVVVAGLATYMLGAFALVYRLGFI